MTKGPQRALPSGLIEDVSGRGVFRTVEGYRVRGMLLYQITDRQADPKDITYSLSAHLDLWFYVFSNVNGQTTQLFRATNPAGPWTHTINSAS
jgi:hypothetical protein